MALSVVNNVASLNMQTNLNRTSGNLSKSLERLSSGLKINRGADGPAALVISEQRRTQIAGLQTAIDNTNKAVSLVQTSEGALNEINSLLAKVRGLALDSANSGVNDSNSQAANQAEITNALSSIDKIATTTQFGTRKLLDGSAGLSGVTSDTDVKFLKADSGTKAGTYEINITTAAENGTAIASQVQSEALGQDETLTINGVAITLGKGLSQADVVSSINEATSQTGVKAEIDATSKATRLITTQYGSAAQVTVQSSVAATASSKSSGFGNVALNDAGVNIVGTIDGQATTGTGNVLTATAGDAKGVSVQLTGEANSISTVDGQKRRVTVTDNSLTFQIGANGVQTASIAIDRVNTDGLGVGLEDNKFGTLSAISVLNTSDVQEAISVIDQAITDVSNLRGKLGAFQANTLESSANTLRASLENTTAAESVIRDTDFATEIAHFTRLQVQLQAGATVLGNANQIPQLIASLLRG